MNHMKETLSGTLGGIIKGDWRYPRTQISIAGRTTGAINVRFKAVGAEDFEEFDPPMAINVGGGLYTAVASHGSIEAIECTPSDAGTDFTVTLVQTIRGKS